MARILYTVQNLVDEVRAQLDENNQDSVDDNVDILPTLNRAQDYAFDILARKYAEPILKYKTLVLLNGIAEYDISQDVFEDRVLKIEIMVPAAIPVSPTVGATYREIQRVTYRDISNYESASKTNVPYYYAIYGRKIRFLPTPTGTYNARLWFLRDPEKLVPPQGRVTIMNSTSNYCILDQAGSLLSTEADQLESYVNWIDGQTGDIKGTLQIQSIQGNKVTFRTVPARATVLTRSVVGGIAQCNNTDFAPAVDDYIAPIDGTCVPYYGRPTCNFLIQYAVAEIVRKLGGASDQEQQVLQKFEQQVERTWVGREQQLRIKKRSQNWGVPTRRWYYE